MIIVYTKNLIIYYIIVNAAKDDGDGCDRAAAMFNCAMEVCVSFII